MMPILLGFIGYIASIVGVFSMAFLKNGDDPAVALRNTTFIGAGFFWLGGYGAIQSGLIGVEMGIMHSVVWAASSEFHRPRHGILHGH